MKMIILITLLTSLTAHARQYIQCSPMNTHATDRMVINLDGDQSTLFMTTGLLTDMDMEPEIRILKDLYADGSDEEFYYFKTEGEVTESLKIPAKIIGEYSSFFQVEVTHTSSDRSQVVAMSCFSSLYDN